MIKPFNLFSTLIGSAIGVEFKSGLLLPVACGVLLDRLASCTKCRKEVIIYKKIIIIIILMLKE